MDAFAEYGRWFVILTGNIILLEFFYWSTKTSSNDESASGDDGQSKLEDSGSDDSQADKPLKPEPVKLANQV